MVWLMAYQFSQEERIAGGIRSGQVRAERKKNTLANPQPNEFQTQLRSDPYAAGLLHAQKETLKELRKAATSKDRAAHARALRELRETWHMVTGEPRPGIRRESGRRQRPEPSGPAFSLPGEVQAQAVSRPAPSPTQAQPSVPSTTTASVGQVQLQPPSTTSAEPIKP